MRGSFSESFGAFFLQGFFFGGDLDFQIVQSVSDVDKTQMQFPAEMIG